MYVYDTIIIEKKYMYIFISDIYMKETSQQNFSLVKECINKIGDTDTYIQ